MLNNFARRLAIFLPELVGAGAQRVMLNLTYGLANKGYLIDLIVAQAKGSYIDEVPESIHLIDLKSPGVLTSFPALVKFLRRERPITLLSSLHANIVAVWAKGLVGYPLRVVLCQHDVISLLPGRNSSLKGRLMPILIKKYYPCADHIVAVSKGVAEHLSKYTGIPRYKIQVIYNPVITPNIQNKILEPINHPWFNLGEPPVLISIGSLSRVKDFSTLIRAFAQVRRKYLLRLLILGEGSERPILEALIKQLNIDQDVSLPGFIQNPYPFLSRSSVFILSSSAEGLPTVLIEALYCGIPVIATDCPYGPHEILDGGKYGRLVPVGDVDALSHAICEALNGEIPPPPRESWSGYDQNAILDQYLDIMLNG